METRDRRIITKETFIIGLEITFVWFFINVISSLF